MISQILELSVLQTFTQIQQKTFPLKYPCIVQRQLHNLSPLNNSFSSSWVVLAEDDTVSHSPICDLYYFFYLLKPLHLLDTHRPCVCPPELRHIRSHTRLWMEEKTNLAGQKSNSHGYESLTNCNYGWGVFDLWRTVYLVNQCEQWSNGGWLVWIFQFFSQVTVWDCIP